MGEFLSFITCIFIACSLVFGLWHLGFEAGFEAGQVQAINGEIYYELQTRPSGETRWVELDEAKRKGGCDEPKQ